MDTQSDAIFEAGDTFKKPSFLVSIRQISGVYDSKASRKNGENLVRWPSLVESC